VSRRWRFGLASDRLTSEADMPRRNKDRHPSPVLYHLSIALTAAALGVLGLWCLRGGPWSWHEGLAGWLVAVNATAFAYYGFDKARARRGGRRVPELVLHGLALLGGSLGAYAGMRLFRHKTLKGRFRVVFWLIVAAQVVLVLWVVRELWLARPSAARPQPSPAQISASFCLAGREGRVKWLGGTSRDGDSFSVDAANR
jgi:uncharacterized membrane protein YsdA (DUF1294 family)